MKIAIIGAGLAGTSLAFTLKQAGCTPEIFEAGDAIASGASGNPIGLINPRFSAHRLPDSDYFTAAFAMAIRTFHKIQSGSDINWKACGALHLLTDDKKEKRFPQTLENWGWPADHMRLVTPDEASDIAGISIEKNALYLPDSGYVCPEKLCRHYAADIPLHLNTPVKSPKELDSDIIILANGAAMLGFEETARLPLGTVRGQITQIRATENSAKLKCNLGFGGYCSPAIQGAHTLGATFQRWLDHTDLLTEDDEQNLQNLQTAVPALTGNYEITGRRASLRTAAKDHFPIAGRLPGHDNLYISTGHGSHGIISTLASAQLITDMILKRPLSQSLYTANALSPARFL